MAPVGTAGLALALVLAPAVQPARACPFEVEDGDTFLVRATGERIRPRGYDTPEIERAACEAELRLGHVARRRLAHLLCGEEPVAIERGRRRVRDVYGRTLAEVSIGERPLARLMIAEGLARRLAGRRRSWCNGLDRQPGAPAPSGETSLP